MKIKEGDWAKVVKRLQDGQTLEEASREFDPLFTIKPKQKPKHFSIGQIKAVRYNNGK